MSDQHASWPSPSLSADSELERADELLDQADAFLRRHRAGFAATADAPPHLPTPAPDPFDDEDLPILTDVVDDFDLAAPVATSGPPATAAAAQAQAALRTSTSGADGRTLSAATVIDRLADARSRQFAPQAPPLADEAHTMAAAMAGGTADSAVARAVDAWLASELPQILARELAQLSFRVHDEVRTGLRAAIHQALANPSAATSASAPARAPAAGSQGDDSA